MQKTSFPLIIVEWLRKNPKLSICTMEGMNEFRDITVYQDYHGLREFRNTVAKIMGKVRENRAIFDLDCIVMSDGVIGAHEWVTFCLVDSSDAFLVPTLHYLGFGRDLRWRTWVQLFPVVCESSNDFKVTREDTSVFDEEDIRDS